jgi:ACT domain-containing protein
MANEELLRRVIAEVLSEVQGGGVPRGGAHRPPAPGAPDAAAAARAPGRPAPPDAGAGPVTFQTPRGSLLPVLPPGTEPPLDYCALCVEQEQKRGRKRAVLTATGKNNKGIVARMTQVIAEASGDILDISQTLVSDYFTMIIIVDIGGLDTTFEEFKHRVTEAAQALGIQTMMMHEDIMASLHRV